MTRLDPDDIAALLERFPDTRAPVTTVPVHALVRNTPALPQTELERFIAEHGAELASDVLATGTCWLRAHPNGELERIDPAAIYFNDQELQHG